MITIRNGLPFDVLGARPARTTTIHTADEAGRYADYRAAERQRGEPTFRVECLEADGSWTLTASNLGRAKAITYLDWDHLDDYRLIDQTGKTYDLWERVPE